VKRWKALAVIFNMPVKPLKAQQIEKDNPMHTMLKRTLICLALAVVTGGVGLIGISPEITKAAKGISLVFVVLMMFCAVGYSLRGEDYRT
jgi:uncharacterized membrane protein YtjA (UPF0391 family)